MKLSEIRKLSQNFPIPNINGDQSRFLEQAQALGWNVENFYQELEMDSEHVDTHMDITYSNDHLQIHSHRYYELICCRVSCGAEYLVGTHRYKLQRGDIIFVPPDVSHRPILPDHMAEPYVRDVLWISNEFMGNMSVIFPEFSPTILAENALYRTRGTKREYLEDLFRAGVREAEAAEVGWQAAVASNTIQILIHLLRASQDESTQPLRAEKPDLLDQVLAYVEEHLGEKITLAEVAKHFFISESTITQTFRKRMGVSFYRCVTQRRLIAAKAFIERGIPMESVAEQVGFSDYSAFFRSFKQEFGISPRQYRKLQGEGK